MAENEPKDWVDRVGVPPEFKEPEEDALCRPGLADRASICQTKPVRGLVGCNQATGRWWTHRFIKAIPKALTAGQWMNIPVMNKVSDFHTAIVTFCGYWLDHL